MSEFVMVTNECRWGYSNDTDVKKSLLFNAYYLTQPYICSNQIIIIICL